ncbi:MAG: ATP synthase F1 subunit gamma [Clostridiales Family XIII bacterium]|jgi:F-type H+-transporting ATPase subunit gamma|nr:ATP synthase F1 subunit gamma [Clostridiales Family XIII bacterium]
MENIKDIKRRMKSISSINQITTAMKLVSAAKLRKAKRQFDHTKHYFQYVISALENLFNSGVEVPDDYLPENRKIVKTAYVIITSNRGLAGSFNQNVIKKAEQEMAEDSEKPVIIAVGGKGKEYFEKRGYDIAESYLRPPEDIEFANTLGISDAIVDFYDKKEVDEVMIIWTAFKTPMEQEVRTKILLPFDEDLTYPEDKKETMPIYIEYEPSPQKVFNYLVPKYFQIKLYNAIVESATCEHQARRIAMENASDNASEMIEELNLFYNRARQAAITSEITEIVSGADAI